MTSTPRKSFKKISFFLFFFGLFSCLLSAQKLDLIPSPQQIIPQEGFFQMNDLIPVVLDKNAGKEEKQAVWMLIDGYQYFFGKDLPVINKIRKGKCIVLRNLAEEQPRHNEERTILPVGEEGYQLNITPDKIEIIANSNAGLFYGTQTLLQLFRNAAFMGSVSCMTINDMPSFLKRGWRFDLLPNQPPSFEYLKNLIVLTAHYKYNLLDFSENKTLSLLSDMELFYLEKFANTYHVEILNDNAAILPETICDVNHHDEIYPRFHATAEFITRCLSEKKQDTMAILTYSGNTGNLFLDNWYSLLWGAEMMWNSLKINEKQVFLNRLAQYDHALNTQLFELEFNAVTTMQEVDSLKMMKLSYPLKDEEFWSSIKSEAHLSGRDIQNSDQLSNKATDIEEKLGFLLTSQQTVYDDIILSEIFAVQKIGFIALKNLVRAALKAENKESANLTEMKQAVQLLIENVEHFKKAHAAIWEIENRQILPVSILEKYDQLSNDLKVIELELSQEK